MSILVGARAFTHNPRSNKTKQKGTICLLPFPWQLESNTSAQVAAVLLARPVSLVVDPLVPPFWISTLSLPIMQRLAAFIVLVSRPEHGKRSVAASVRLVFGAYSLSAPLRLSVALFSFFSLWLPRLCENSPLLSRWSQTSSQAHQQ